MGTFNFKSQENGFPLYAMEVDQYIELQRDECRYDYDTEEEFEDAVRWDWENGNWIIEEISEVAREFDNEILWHRVAVEPGYYDGFQIYVEREWEESEILEDVWYQVLSGPGNIYSNSNFPLQGSERYEKALSILGNQSVYEDYYAYEIDYTLVTPQQVEEAYALIQEEVSEAYQQEVNNITTWLEDTASYYGLGQITSNGWVVKWA